ncbi:hypothetical protein MLD38_025146 [Melastoma candidum]|uniref:Uncharacterized protein n=1 Tax=Melastoma candidum TaxID=119954 RepID=A0ACB9NW22_9MYRT|nr:hypothetical protein MLD38_025146 [Melastoma candidum]
MSTVPGTYPESKDVAAAFLCNVVDNAETKRHHKGGFEGETATRGERDGPEQDPGSQFCLQEHSDQLKDNRSLKGSKEQIPGMSDVSAIGCQEVRREAEVKILSVSVLSPGRPDQMLPIRDGDSADSRRLVSLKEGSSCQTRFTFLVSNGTVPGLKYTYTVWKAGIRVQNKKILMGSFGPREEAYTYDLPEETVPRGILIRGSYFIRTKLVDEEGRCYMDSSFNYEIRKN